MDDLQMKQAFYNFGRQWFALLPPLICPVTFTIDAPFGRFSPAQDSIWLVDGIKSWMFMELVAPTAFFYAFLRSPLSPTAAGSSPPLTLHHPPTFLAGLFLLHYLNRAIISPLRTPSRSKSHILVPLSAVGFNTINGLLLGTYLSSPYAQKYLEDAFTRPRFWAGIALWALGLIGNIVHDEILLNIRRKAKAKGKARESAEGTGKDGEDDNNGKIKKNKQEHYAIPHGLLYRYISYPNYLCEWLEWLGFALAASPAPSFASFAAYFLTATPPWLFFFSELFLMLPRAWKGHQWYHSRFPDYPKERKAVIPFVL